MSSENNIAVIDKCNIKDLIYNIRGRQVMLDSDLALLYGYELKNSINKLKEILKDFQMILCFKLVKKR